MRKHKLVTFYMGLILVVSLLSSYIYHIEPHNNEYVAEENSKAKLGCGGLVETLKAISKTNNLGWFE